MLCNFYSLSFTNCPYLTPQTININILAMRLNIRLSPQNGLLILVTVTDKSCKACL